MVSRLANLLPVEVQHLLDLLVTGRHDILDDRHEHLRLDWVSARRDLPIRLCPERTSGPRPRPRRRPRTCDWPFSVETMILRMVSSLTSSEPFWSALRSSAAVGDSSRSSWTMV
jgi:hypothetical protein